ncbi:lipopolysaccharide transport periplasmic protein LptA [Thioalkalivibrio denitrificans]|uniref:lipopolysaccharide transport periplasmic protein LptA n=1 Tax=Thioalkalivibrio denitrificans TaxID=108003 RepID=UPI0009841D1A|nr:lipopolysaccharide transport periplasmic protein LptA [Thioalkalivibrio denitrificans]
MTPTARISPDRTRRGGATGRLAAIALTFVLGAVWIHAALAAERDQPIRIQSDTATLDDQRGISVYRGNVVLTQGELVIHSDTLTVYTPGRALTRMEAEGDLATLRTLTEDGREIHAESLHMDYLAEERRVVLTGRARVWQEEDEFRGERIVYHMDDETLDAVAGEAGRVEVIITPREDR